MLNSKRYGRNIQFPMKYIMTTPVVALPAASSLNLVASEMWDKRVGSIVVVDESGKTAGIVTERDMIYYVAKGLLGNGHSANSVLPKDVHIIGPDDTMDVAIEKMRTHNIRHLVVTDTEKRPLGVVSIRDILDASLRFLGIFAPTDSVSAAISAPE